MWSRDIHLWLGISFLYINIHKTNPESPQHTLTSAGMVKLVGSKIQEDRDNEYSGFMFV